MTPMANLPAPTPLPNLSSIQLHPDARQLANTFVADYGGRLVNLAKILAVQDGANEVQSGHIDAARLLLRRTPERKWSTEVALIVGGALLGAFVQGFIEATAEAKLPLIVIYVLLGFLGVGIVVWALRRQ